MLKKAVYQALVYHHLFSFPLTLQEIEKWIYGFKEDFSEKELQGVLEELVQSGRVEKEDGCFFLPEDAGQVIKKRRKKEASLGKLEQAERIARILAKIPFIEMVAASGSLAMQAADEDDDLDLLIVTQANRLWVSRLLAVFILELLGKRRRPQPKKVKDKVCLNLFLDGQGLEVEKKNVYTAHEVCQIIPLVNKNNVYQRFLEKNQWVKDYWPRAAGRRLKVKGRRSKVEGRKSKVEGRSVFKRLIDFVDKVLFKLQFWYMKSKMTNERVDYHKAFFHPDDLGRRIVEKFEKTQA